MIVKSYAKINLYLKIDKKLKNNYHNIQTVMQLVQLHDNISFEKLNKDRIIIESNNKSLENIENLAYKAADKLKKEFGINKGLKINIEKNIPMASGLGGGSSNAASTLIVLNKMWNLNLSEKELINFGMEIGSDVPFFIKGKTALIEGIGNIIKPLRKSMSINIVLVNPGFKVSTKWAYNQFDKNKKKIVNKKNINFLINAINKKDIIKISENMHNDFSFLIEKKFKEIKEINLNFKKFNCLNSLVSGSGPTVIGLFDSIYTAREAYFKLRNLYPFVYITKTI